MEIFVGSGGFTVTPGNWDWCRAGEKCEMGKKQMVEFYEDGISNRAGLWRA